MPVFLEMNKDDLHLSELTESRIDFIISLS